MLMRVDGARAWLFHPPSGETDNVRMPERCSGTSDDKGFVKKEKCQSGNTASLYDQGD
jgi:hypothetical protein